MPDTNRSARRSYEGRHARQGNSASVQTVEPSPPAEPDSGTGNAGDRQLFKNAGGQYVSLITSMVLSFVLTPLALHHLGESDYSLWILLPTIGSYIGLLDAGVAVAGVQQMASALARGEKQLVADVLVCMRRFFIVTAVLAVVITAGLTTVIDRLLNVPADSAHTAEMGMIIVGTVIAMSFLNSTPIAALAGAGRSDRTSYIVTAVSLATSGGQIACVLLGGGVVALLLISLAGTTATTVLTERAARRLGLMTVKHGHVSRAVMWQLIRHGGRNVTVSIGGMLSYQLDAVLIGMILPVAQVAPYNIALTTPRLVRSLSTAGTDVLVPTYSHSSAVKHDERQFRLYSRAILVSMTITIPMVIALVTFGESLLRLWLHSVPDQTYEILVALNIGTLIQLPGHQSFIFLTGIAKNHILARMAIPLALANVTLSIIFTIWLGPIGPAIGTLPIVLVVDFIFLPIYCCRAMGVPVRRYVKEALQPLAIPAVAAGITAVGLWSIEHQSEILAVFESVAVVLVAWLVFLPGLARREPKLQAVVARIPVLRSQR